MMPCAIFKKDTDMEKQNFSMWVPSSQKICGVSRGAQPLGSGSSNRADSPVGIGCPEGNSVLLGGGIQRGRRPPWHTIFRRKV